MHAQQESQVQQGLQEYLAPLDRPDLQISPLVADHKGLTDLSSTPSRKHWPDRTNWSTWRNWIDWTYWSHR